MYFKKFFTSRIFQLTYIIIMRRKIIMPFQVTNCTRNKYANEVKYNNQICKWGKIQGSNTQMSKYARN